MRFTDLLLPNPKLILHPEVKKKLLTILRQKFETELTPDLWKDLILSYGVNEHFPKDFIEETHDMAKSVIENYLKENNIISTGEDQKQYWAEELWEESQSFWSEISDVIAQNLNFVDSLIRNSRKIVEDSFPDCNKVFGEKATHFLTDLIFQACLRRYTKISKPDLVDMRRMLNIAGQIVEEIFSTRILHKESDIGEIYRLFKSFKHEDSPDKTSFYSNFPNGKILLSEQFLKNLKLVKNNRNPYSHGSSLDTNLESDFWNGMDALADDKFGVVAVMYRLLTGKKN